MNAKKEILVEKRDGRKEPLDLDKIHKILTWACEDVTGVSVSDIAIKSQLQFFDGMKATEIHSTLTKTAADLISEDAPNYQYVAAKLINFNLRKEVYGMITPWPIKKLVEKNVATGYYTKELLEWYDDQEWRKMDKMIKHDRDFEFSYTGMKQLLGKYLVQNRVTKEYYETPQMAYMLIAATLFHGYPEDTRMKFVKEYYDALSKWDISVPTPILAGVRTPTKQFSSCVLINSGDSLSSINATASSIVNYVSRKAGIGINAGRIRAVGSEIRNGEIKHTGVIPFLKYFHAALKSCSQGGVRGGAATVYWPFFHYEFENLIVLKNNKGVEENRIRHMDYGVQLNRLAYKRLIEGGKITFFSPHEVPDLMDAFYSGDNDEFERIYEKYERSRKIKMKYSLPALEVFGTIMDERVSTGRIYIQNIDHCNTQGSFISKLHPIEQSNLCVVGDTTIDVLLDDEILETIIIEDLAKYLVAHRSVKVKSYDLNTGTEVYSEITDFEQTGISEELITITCEKSGKSVTCTGEHKIFTMNRGYVEAKNLREDDVLKIFMGNTISKH